MSRSFTRLILALAILISAEVSAIGLGDIKLDSALNEPLRAEIQLLSASSEELEGLSVALASEETFARYGIDRPFYLQGVEFNTENGIVRLRSRAPITEPFLTFLVEATWPSGRLLREYTVLLDPPTFAPPAVQQAPAVAAPTRSSSSDSGQIQRQPATSTPSQPAVPARPSPQPSQPARASSTNQPVDNSPYDTNPGGDMVVGSGDTLWGIAARMRPDTRLTMNQTMLAIYEANPSAFGGNINVLKAGSALRIPSADEVFRISRGDALSEVQRHNSAWDGSSGSGSAAVEPSTRPRLTLVPPDEEPAGSSYDDSATYEPLSREEEIESRISELESADVPDQQSLIEVRDNELAELRRELADMRGEAYEPPLGDDTTDEADFDSGDETFVDEVIDETDSETNIDDMFPDQDELDAVADGDEAVEDAIDEPEVDPSTIVRTTRSDDKGIVDQILEFVTGTVGKIILGALAVVVALLVFFMRRGGDDDDDDSGP